MLTLTPAAAEQIRRATEASEAQALALRVAALRDADGNPINPAHPWNEKSRAANGPEPTGSPRSNANRGNEP